MFLLEWNDMKKLLIAYKNKAVKLTVKCLFLIVSLYLVLLVCLSPNKGQL